MEAEWIWFDAGQPEGPVFARARNSFELARAPSRALLNITCFGHYRLWVNGHYIGRGPASSGDSPKKYDAYEIAAWMQSGRNVIAVAVIYYGYRTGSFPESSPGLLCYLQGDTDDSISCGSGSWKLSVDPCYDAQAVRRNTMYGPIEIYDARQETEWQEPLFDESEWTAAHCLKGAPEQSLVPRRIPFPQEKRLMPEQIVSIGEVLSQEFNPSIHGGIVGNLAVHLALDVPEQPRITHVEHPERMLVDDNEPAIIHQPSPLDQASGEQYCATVILDFGREITGYGWIDVEGNDGAVIDMIYGERLTGGRVPPIVQNCAYVDRYILKEGRQRHQVYDWKGYRYMQMTFRELTAPLKVYCVGASFTSYPVESKGSFRCSDPLIERLWSIGAYTQQLCMHDRLMDTPWREQSEWLGDGRIQLLIIQNAFGDMAMPRNFISNFAESQWENGIIPSVAYHDQYAFADYALFWVIAVQDVLIFDGELQFAAECLKPMERLFDYFESFRNEDGFLEDVPDVFIDWAKVGKTGVCATLNAIYALALSAASQIAAECGEFRLAKTWGQQAERIRECFHDQFWDKARELYVDHRVKGKKMKVFSQHTQALAVLASAQRVDAKLLLTKAVTEASLVQTEPYFTFYLCEALAAAGLADKAMEIISRKWGAMVVQGATTFWEEWQRSGTFRAGKWIPRPRSHCHAWSAAPTAWLSRYVLGVKTEADGSVRIYPHPCGLVKAWGEVPARHGIVRIEWEIREGQMEVNVELPAETAFYFVEPEAFKGKCTVHHNSSPFMGG